MLISSHSSYSLGLSAASSAQVQSAASGRPEQRENSTGSATNADAPVRRAAVETKLSESEQKQVRELSERDREVRAHEQAHAAAAGGLAKGGPSFSYKRGPDGKLYAVGGEVQIDSSPVSGDPQATIQKAQRIRSAALAPAQPSSQDRAVAAQAAKMAAEASAELASAPSFDAESRSESAQNQDQGIRVAEASAGQAKEVPEASGDCAICGGQHSAESHSAAVQEKISNTFLAEHSDSLGKLLSVSA